MRQSHDRPNEKLLNCPKPLCSSLSGIFSNLLRSALRRPTVTRRSMMAGMALVAVFVIAMLMRLFPAKYGFYLNEFDPYYDYKAANFIVTSFDQSWNAGQLGGSLA